MVIELSAPWREFRDRLSGRLGRLVEGEVVDVRLEGGSTASEGRGLRLSRSGADLSVELAGELDEDSRQWLADRGWEVGDGPAQTWGERAAAVLRCSVDGSAALAAESAQVLVHVLGCIDPAFLSAGALDLQGLRGAPGGDGGFPAAWEVTMPSSPDHLRDLIDRALDSDDLVHDIDGDVVLNLGDSAVYVRAGEERPCVELYGWLVRGLVRPDQVEAARREIDFLVRRLPYLAFALDGDRLQFRHELAAAPFSATQLRLVVDRLAQELDQVAQETALRLGGRCWRDPDDDDHVCCCAPSGSLEPLRLEVDTVIELVLAGRADPATVAGVLGHDRAAVVRSLGELRRGWLDAAPLEPDALASVLRAALVWLVDRESAAWDDDARGDVVDH